MDITGVIVLAVLALLLISIAAVWIYRIRRRRRLYALPPLYPAPRHYQPPESYPPMTLQPTHYPPGTPNVQDPFMQYPTPGDPSIQNPVQQKLFIPKGKLSANPPINHLPQFQVQHQVYDSSPTGGFSGRGSDKGLKRTCFLTGEPRSTCACDACQAERKQKE